jgi:hypothetical protein
LTWYCTRDPSSSILDRGRLKEWSGVSWFYPSGSSSVPYTLQCHSPDVAVRGDAGVVVWRDDGNDLQGQTAADTSGAWTGYSAGTTMDEHSPRLGFAFGAPYVITTSISAGLGDYRVYVECVPDADVGLCVGLPEVRGRYRDFDDVFIPTTVGTSASFAGDDTVLYYAFTSSAVQTPVGQGCLNIERMTQAGTTWLGDCFYVGDGPFSPEVAIVSGQPAVAWIDGDGLQVARWNGTAWMLIGQATSSQSFQKLRVESSGSSLYLAFQLSGSPTEVVVQKWDGATWSMFPNPLESLTGTSISLQDLALFEGDPHVALLVDGVVRIARMTLTPRAATLVSPTGTVTDTTPTYTWNAVPEATDYYLRATDGSGSTAIDTWYTAAQAGCESGTGTCSVTPTTALAPGSARWWIRTRNGTLDGPWSSGLNFTVITAASPTPPTSRGQLQANGTTAIPLGGAATSATVVFRGTVSDPGGQQVRLQVEAKQVGASFTGAVSCQSGLVASGTATTCSMSGLAFGANYHWQTRTVDSGGLPSAWASYATNAETAADFIVNRPPAVPTSRSQRQADGITAITLGGTATSSTVVFRATVTDPDPGQTVRLRVEVKPVGTAFTGTTSCQSALVASGTATSCAVTGLALGTSYHWRLRAVDSKGAASAWASYATNAETAADFKVTTTVNQSPSVPISRGQRQADGTTAISLGGTATSSTVVFRGTVSDPNAGQTVRLQVEVKPVGTSFTGTVSCESALVSSGTAASCSVGSLANGTSYHWRTRSKDSQAATSAWASYATNTESEADFVVNTNQSPTAPAELGQRQANGTTVIAIGGTATSATVVFRGTVSDPNAGQTVRLQVEVKPVGTNFTGTVSCESGLVSPGTATSCSVGSLAAGTSYHWRARTRDSQGATSAWTSFGGNAETAADFKGPLTLTGTWVLTGTGTRTNCGADNGSGSGSITLYLTQTGTTLSGSGSYVIPDETGNFSLTSGTVSGTSFSGALSGSSNYGDSFTGNYQGSVSGTTMTLSANTTDTVYGCYTTLSVSGTRQ